MADKAQAALLLTLLARAYCHLCDDMRAVVAPLAAAHGATLVEVDVDAVPALEARYGDRVPVLFLGDPQHGLELGHYTCDAAAVDAALAAASAVGRSAGPSDIC